MADNILIPWYVMETDPGRQKCFNRPTSAVYIWKPQPKPEPKPEPAPTQNSQLKPKSVRKQPQVIYRPADVVMMELTVKTRHDLVKDISFEWSKADFYHDLCISWFNEQKTKGLTEVVYLCGEEVIEATGKVLVCCLVCRYSDGHLEGFTPGLEKKDNENEPAIMAVEVKSDYQKPRFVDNAEAFKNALQTIADYAPYEGWKQRFHSGLRIMQDETVKFYGQKDTFNIQPPYFRYLYAAQVTHLGFGMGSWFDLPMVGSESFKAVTKLFSTQRHNAIMYAINNC
jgi:hypothetical protein